MDENLPQPQVLINPGPVLPVQPTPKRFPLKWIIIMALLAGIVLTGTYLIFKSQSSKRIPVQVPIQTIQPSLSPTPDPTANWKMYTNIKHHFSAKYPQDFSIVRGSGEDAKTDQDYQDVDQVGFISSSKLTHFDIYIDPKNPGILTSPTPVTKAILGQNVEGKEKKQTYQEVPSNKIVTQLSQDFSIVQNGKEYLVSFSTTTYSPEELSSATETFDQFLSTFKFTEATPLPTCRPRPVCLDAKQPCLMPETADMCPPAKGKFCGGIANIQCSIGYTCKLDGSYPDAGGKCVKE